MLNDSSCDPLFPPRPVWECFTLQAHISDSEGKCQLGWWVTWAWLPGTDSHPVGVQTGQPTGSSGPRSTAYGPGASEHSVSLTCAPASSLQNVGAASASRVVSQVVLRDKGDAGWNVLAQGSSPSECCSCRESRETAMNVHRLLPRSPAPPLQVLLRLSSPFIFITPAPQGHGCAGNATRCKSHVSLLLCFHEPCAGRKKHPLLLSLSSVFYHQTSRGGDELLNQVSKH